MPQNDMSGSSSVSESKPFFGLVANEVDEHLAASGLQRWRGKQIRSWVYAKLVTDTGKMTNLSQSQQSRIRHVFSFDTAQVVREQRSSDGTLKLLLQWPDQQVAETVMIPDMPRRTACISSQVGCPVGCSFCASGIGGVKGNLSAAQIVEQVFQLNRALALNNTESRITNVVFMGMGEPMANYANVMQAVRILHDGGCLNMSARRITISTVGVPKRMLELASEELPINLAISLHAPTETLRRQLIPWAEHFPLGEVLDAARQFFEKTGREITLEYILLSGINDRPEHAKQLAKLCKTLRANVNLIRYNEVSGLVFKRPETEDVIEFQRILREAGMNAHVRKSRGRDIDAACGQLRRKVQDQT